MNGTLIQRSMPVLRAQPPPGQLCACDRSRQSERPQDTAPTVFTEAIGVTGKRIGATLITDIGLQVRLARLKSP